MKLVVGLGNPGPRYAPTRHNVGARVVERLAERQHIALDEARFHGRFGAGSVAGVDVGLLLPDTFMNESGRSLAAALAAFEVDGLLVASDDVDLPFGRLRLRARGSAGGQRGLADVLAQVGHNNVPRLRFGIGRPAASGSALLETTDWVLQPFSAAEERALPGALDRAAEAIECFLAQGIGEAMNRYNAASE